MRVNLDKTGFDTWASTVPRSPLAIKTGSGHMKSFYYILDCRARCYLPCSSAPTSSFKKAWHGMHCCENRKDIHLLSQHSEPNAPSPAQTLALLLAQENLSPTTHFLMAFCKVMPDNHCHPHAYGLCPDRSIMLHACMLIPERLLTITPHMP